MYEHMRDELIKIAATPSWLGRAAKRGMLFSMPYRQAILPQVQQRAKGLETAVRMVARTGRAALSQAQSAAGRRAARQSTREAIGKVVKRIRQRVPKTPEFGKI